MSDSGSPSDSETASGYESDRRTATDDSPLSDWDATDVPTTWNCPQTAKDEDVVKSKSPQSHLRLEVGTTKGPLFDSGYQKSPSVPDESPQSLSNNDHKLNKLSNVLSLFDNFDKINELDAVRKEKKFFNFTSNLPPQEVMKKICQEIVKHPIAGPSTRDSRRRQTTKSHSSDSDDSAEDVKFITNCILENSLNKLAVKEEEDVALIQEIIPEPIPEEPPPLPVEVVENGDLANNNRDLEGNNYPQEPQVENDNDILDNVNMDNNNEVEPAGAALPLLMEEVVMEGVVEEAPQADVEVAWSSREALFDVNSHVDLLEDFEMDVVANEVARGVDCDTATSDEGCACVAVLPAEESSFPNWLLQIFEEGETLAHEDLHDEPHFYCQGDGLGVHPSTVALNDDEEDDDDEGNDDESGTDSSSRSGSVDFGSVDNVPSAQDVSANTEEARTEENLVCVGHSVSTSTSTQNPVSSSDQEVFVNAEESESNVVTSSIP